jgi:predicted DNA-binding transcriptional regulator AlpA
VPTTPKCPPRLPDQLLPDLVSALPDWSSPQDLADWLHVPVASVYRWNQTGTGPRPTKIGKHRRYSRQSISSWLLEQQQADQRPA